MSGRAGPPTPRPYVHYRVQRCRCGGATRGVAVIVATTLSSWRRATSFLMCIESDGVAANFSARQHQASKARVSLRYARQCRDSSRADLLHPGFDATLLSNDTSTAIPETKDCAPSFRSPPDASRAPFPHRSPRRSSANAACGGLKPPTAGRLRRAKPSSPAQHRVKKLYLQTELLSTFVAHVDSQPAWRILIRDGEKWRIRHFLEKSLRLTRYRGLGWGYPPVHGVVGVVRNSWRNNGFLMGDECFHR